MHDITEHPAAWTGLPTDSGEASDFPLSYRINTAIDPFSDPVSVLGVIARAVVESDRERAYTKLQESRNNINV